MSETVSRRQLLDWRPRTLWSRLAIVLLLVAPIAVAGTMMWAMWDPSKYLRDVKLAVVNEDTGVEIRGENTNYGARIMDGLVKTEYLNFAEAKQEEAQQGLIRGKYMMVVTIPANFSKTAATIISDNPVRPEITFATNDYYGTNSSVITASMVPKLQTSVENAITKEYATKVIDGLTKLSDGLAKAAENAGKLDEGAGKLQDGSTKLQEGGAKAVEGIGKLDDGATQLKDGAGQLTQGTGQLKAGVGELNTGAKKLDAGAHQLAGGMDTLVDGTGKLADGAGQIEGGVTQLTDMLIPLLRQAQQEYPLLRQAEDTLRGIGMVEQANKVGDIATKLDPNNTTNMVTQLGKLRDGTALLHQNLADPQAQYLGGVLKLQDGAHQLANGTTQLTDGVGRLSQGAGALDAGANKLAGGIGALKDGTSQLHTGGGQLKDGMDQLAGGMTQLKNGTNEFSTKLNEGLKSAPQITKPDISAQNIAVPITFLSPNEHPVQTVISATDPTAKQVTGGVSMLLLMVFGSLIMLLLALLLPYRLGRRGKLSAVLGAWAILSTCNFGTLLGLALVSTSLGWHPASWGALIPALAAMATAGAAIHQLFQVLCGRAAGGALGLGFYALGIMVFGGVWPIVTVPAFIRIFHPLHPLTYAKTAFARATDGISDASSLSALITLVVFTVVALAVSLVALRRQSAGAPEAAAAAPVPATAV